jgi:hypothetical protein
MFRSLAMRNSGLWPGADPTTALYSASAVKMYTATSILVRFEIKICSSTLKNALAYYIQRWRCSCEFGSRRIGSCSEINISKHEPWQVNNLQVVMLKSVLDRPASGPSSFKLDCPLPTLEHKIYLGLRPKWSFVKSIPERLNLDFKLNNNLSLFNLLPFFRRCCSTRT